MRRRLTAAFVFILIAASSAAAQSSVDRSPNVHGVWGLDTGSAVFIFAHRFESINGGDEVASIPTFTLALGVPLGLTIGTEFTSFSEVHPGNLGGNEAQFWLKRPLGLGPVESAVLAAYNTTADSFDGAVDLRAGFGRFRVFAEGRAFSDIFGTGEGGAAGTIGGALRLTEYIGVTGDVGQVLTEGDYPAAWSAGVTIEIPASPHTMSLLVTNTGATTLQGVSREKVFGEAAVRYGFSFHVPIGGRGRWARIFDPITGD